MLKSLSRLVREPDPWPPPALEATIEHPWAFHQIQALGEELTILELGNPDPGLRSTLARAGHRVIVVGGVHPPATAEDGAVVALRGVVDVPAASVDVLVSIQGATALSPTALAEGRRILRPGGHVVVTTGADADPSALLEALDAEAISDDLVRRHGFTTLPATPPPEAVADGVARCVVGRLR